MFDEQTYRDAVLIDLETRSPVDLRTAGGHNYAAHPLTSLLSVSWLDHGDEYLWIPGLGGRDLVRTNGMVETHVPERVTLFGGPDVPKILVALARSGRPFVAHNAWGFDQIVWTAKTPAEAHPADWIDTDPLARMVGLPGGLDRIGVELRRQGKQEAGRSRLKKWMRVVDLKPVPAGDQIVIGSYCHDDTCGLLKALWDHLHGYEFPAFEQAVLKVHRSMNAEGVRLDSVLAEELKNLAAAAAQQALVRCQELSGGKAASPFQEEGDLRKRPKVFAWIASRGADIGNSLNKKVVEQLIRDAEAELEAADGRDTPSGDPDDVDPDAPEPPEKVEAVTRVPAEVVEFLKVRFAALRVTRGKVDAALKSRYAGRLTDLLVHYGALTGRSAGRRVQVHNFTRPAEAVPVWDWKIKDTGEEGPGLYPLFEKTGRFDPDACQEILDHYLASIRRGGRPKAQPATLDDAASTLYRGALLPDEGEMFVIADYNAIEFRGGGWLAGEDKILAYFRDKVDPYLAMASQIYGVPVTSKKDERRQTGKVVDLGCLFGLGPDKLTGYAASMGVNLTTAGTTANACVTAFRDLFPKLAGRRTGYVLPNGMPAYRGGYWKKLDEAAVQACEGGGVQRAGKHIYFEKRKDDLHMVLPSGRPIIYRKALAEDTIPWWEQGKEKPRMKRAVRYQSPRGFRNTLYGGKLLENADQATMGDLLRQAKVDCRAVGLKTRFDVHDEIVASVRNREEAHEVVRIMSSPPKWAEGLSVLAEALTAPRYAKAAPMGWDKFDYENGRLCA